MFQIERKKKKKKKKKKKDAYKLGEPISIIDKDDMFKSGVNMGWNPICYNQRRCYLPRRENRLCKEFFPNGRSVNHKKLKNMIIQMGSLILFVLRFYGPVKPIGSCRVRSVNLTTRLLGRFRPLSG